jgi:hypothetical protein
MKTTDFIRKQIEKLPNGHVFSYADLMKQPEQKEAIIKALNRMVTAGELTKLAKGKYYKAEETVFGNLEPDQYQVVKDLLEVNGKVVGYLTGFSIYNKLGLTTQVSNEIQIGKNDIRSSIQRGRYTISFIRQKNDITKENIPLLQILDAVRYLKKIPDTRPGASYERLFYIIKRLSATEQKNLSKLLLKYPASTRALVGSMFEVIGNIQLVKSLQKSLNPVTAYKIPGVRKHIENAENWNINDTPRK